MRETYEPHHEQGENATLNKILDVKRAGTFQQRVANIFLFAATKGKEDETNGRHHLWQFLPEDPSLWISKNIPKLKRLSAEDPIDELSDIYEVTEELAVQELSDFPLLTSVTHFCKTRPYHEEPKLALVAAQLLTLDAQAAYEEFHGDPHAKDTRAVGAIALHGKTNRSSSDGSSAA